MHKVIELRGRIADMSAGQFRHRFPHPVLVAQQVLQGDLLRPKKKSRPGAPGTRSVGPRTVRRPRAAAAASSVYAGGTMMLAHPAQDDMLLCADVDAGCFPTQRLSNELFVWLSHRNRKTPRSPVTLGRTSRCDVVVNDFTVSNEHAWIVRSPGVKKYFIVDRGSTNGTRVNDLVVAPKQRAVLHSGARVTIGRVAFTYLDPVDFYRLVMATGAPRSRPMLR